MMHLFKKNRKGFTLIELIIAMGMFSILMLLAFRSLSLILFQHAKVTGDLDVNKDIYVAIERFVDLVKTGGVVDYEEYWNRYMIEGGDFTGDTLKNGHFFAFSGFGNYGANTNSVTDDGDGFYHCRSGVVGSGLVIDGNGCIEWILNNSGEINQYGQKQRFGQYRLHHIDANFDKDSDGGDEDGDLNIFGDDDDRDVGAGPELFVEGQALTELYLRKFFPREERFFFRWNVIQDPDVNDITCNLLENHSLDENPNKGCLGNIQFLRLEGADFGLDHNVVNIADLEGKFDGIIDTWMCHEDFDCQEIAFSGGDALSIPTNLDRNWVNIFPEEINVRNVEFWVWPNKDPQYNWADDELDTHTHPYVRMNMTIGLAGSHRKVLRNIDPEFTFSTTINLVE